MGHQNFQPGKEKKSIFKLFVEENIVRSTCIKQGKVEIKYYYIYFCGRLQFENGLKSSDFNNIKFEILIINSF